MKHLGFLPEKAGSSEKGDRNIQNYINKNNIRFNRNYEWRNLLLGKIR